jgi:hypothetical protein
MPKPPLPGSATIGPSSRALELDLAVLDDGDVGVGELAHDGAQGVLQVLVQGHRRLLQVL